MTVFHAIYQRNTGDLTPDFVHRTPLANWLTRYGLTLGDWHRLAGLADRVAPTARRVYPGSSDDLLMTTGVNGPGSALPIKLGRNGSRIELTVRSPGGTLDGLPLLVFVDTFPTGSAPGSYGPLPQVQFDPSRARTLVRVPALPADGVSFAWPIPATPSGTSVLFQAVVFGPGPWSGASAPTTTDGQEVRVR